MRVFLLFSLLALVFGAPLLMKQATNGFHLARFKIDSDWPQIEKRAALLNQEEEKTALKILKQPFTYLARGAQCYVFESRDGGYVIKLFQENRSVMPFSKWKRIFKRKKSYKRKEKITDFNPCFLAYLLAKEETALVYMHLFPTQNLLPKLSVRSPLGLWIQLPIDRYSFVIQKKAKPFRESLLQASLDGNLPSYLTSFFSLINGRLGKGIRNEDASLSSNFGFLDGRAVEIDFGRYLQSRDFLKPAFQNEERKIFVREMRDFMQKHLPHEISVLEKIIAETT